VKLRAAVGKMSDERLRLRLVQAGYQADDVGRLDRRGLLETYAACLADEEEERRTRAAAAEAEGADLFAEAAAAVFGDQEVMGEVPEQQLAGDDQTVGDAQQEEEGDQQGEVAQAAAMALEERRLRLEERRLLMEEQRWRAELAARERKESAELKLKQMELDLKREAAAKEEKNKDTPAVKLKLWGDALRNTISRMPNEPIEIVSWFSSSLDHLFDQLSVPPELRAVLVRPYLNDRAKTLLSRCDASKSQDYKVVKKFLLQELQLTPSVYLEKFNSESKSSNESYHQFGNRLTALFEHYIEARQINNDYDRLAQLMTYDRIKSSLPPFLSRHVLALEASLVAKGGWLGRCELVDALDAYVAGMATQPKPSVRPDSAPKSASTFANKTFSDKAVKNGNKFTTETKGPGQSYAATPKSVMPRRCFGCGSPSHFLNNCPERRSTFVSKSNAASKQVSHCAVEKSHRNAEVESSIRPACEYDRQYNTGVLSACNTGLFTASGGDAADASGIPVGAAPPIHEFSAELPPSDCSGGTIGLQAATSVCTDWPGSGTQCDVISSDDSGAVAHESVIHKSAVNTEKCVDSFLSDGWSKLRYVDVSIDGIPGVIRALNDSGAQICLVRAEVIVALNLPRIGKVMLRDFLGNSHQAEVVTLQMRLANADTFVPVVCAVCDRLSNELLLGTDVVKQTKSWMVV